MPGTGLGDVERLSSHPHKPLRGKNNYRPRFKGEEASSEGFGAWPKVTQVGIGRAGTWWTLQSDLENTQMPPARGTAVTMEDQPVAGTGILRPKGPGGRSERWEPQHRWQRGKVALTGQAPLPRWLRGHAPGTSWTSFWRSEEPRQAHIRV